MIQSYKPTGGVKKGTASKSLLTAPFSTLPPASPFLVYWHNLSNAFLRIPLRHLQNRDQRNDQNPAEKITDSM